jgi:hypothetical protein
MRPGRSLLGRYKLQHSNNATPTTTPKITYIARCRGGISQKNEILRTLALLFTKYELELGDHEM